MDISIIIPVFNEEENLAALHAQLSMALDSLQKEHEIIYVNDGSTDNSLKLLQGIRATDNKVRVFNFDKNYGMTAALDAGVRNARGNFILTVDADLQYDTQDLLKIFNELREYDVVIGVRMSRRESDGFIKFASSRIANHARNMILGENFRDVGCFLRGFRKHCFHNLVMYRGFQVLLVSMLNMRGFRIKEIEVKSSPRKFGTSKFNIKNRFLRELLALLVLRWIKSNRLKYKIIDC